MGREQESLVRIRRRSRGFRREVGGRSSAFSGEGCRAIEDLELLCLLSGEYKPWLVNFLIRFFFCSFKSTVYCFRSASSLLFEICFLNILYQIAGLPFQLFELEM